MKLNYCDAYGQLQKYYYPITMVSGRQEVCVKTPEGKVLGIRIVDNRKKYKGRLDKMTQEAEYDIINIDEK